MRASFCLPSCLLFAVLMLGPAGGIRAGECYMVVDSHSGRILLAGEAGEKRPVASLVKIATAVVTLDWAEASDADLGSLAVVPVSAARMGGVNPMGLQPGDRISLRDALYSALLGSDNVAAQTLANHVGLGILRTRDAPGDTVQTFVKEMNQLAAALGMTRTRFINPHGLDVPAENGYSTAADMARLSIHAMRKPGFAFFVKQKERKISCLRGDQRVFFTVRNTNVLLGREDINGIKTGLTNLSGQCLAASSERKPVVEKLPDGRSLLTPRRLVCVVLGSPDRFARTLSLVREGWSYYEDWMAKGAPVQDPARELLQVPSPR